MTKKTPLTRKQLNELREILERERDAWMEQIKEVNGHGAEAHGDLGDMSSSLADTELLWGLEEHERQYIIDIEEALKRIENGTYGICQECGKPIPYERLKAIPTAKYTVDCKEKIEEGKQ